MSSCTCTWTFLSITISKRKKRVRLEKATFVGWLPFALCFNTLDCKIVCKVTYCCMEKATCGLCMYVCMLVQSHYVGWLPVATSFGRRDCKMVCERSYLVDPASSHMLVSKIKPCMSKYKHLYCETANGSLNQLSFIWLYFTTWIPVVILELIHAKNPNFWKGCIY